MGLILGKPALYPLVIFLFYDKIRTQRDVSAFLSSPAYRAGAGVLNQKNQERTENKEYYNGLHYF